MGDGRIRWVRVASLGVALVLLVVGCEKASCQEECDEDGDCESGLSCFSGQDGRVCMPEDCEGCSTGCTYWREPTSDAYECSFQSCL